MALTNIVCEANEMAEKNHIETLSSLQAAFVRLFLEGYFCFFWKEGDFYD